MPQKFGRFQTEKVSRYVICKSRLASFLVPLYSLFPFSELFSNATRGIYAREIFKEQRAVQKENNKFEGYDSFYVNIFSEYIFISLFYSEFTY